MDNNNSKYKKLDSNNDHEPTPNYVLVNELSRRSSSTETSLSSTPPVKNRCCRYTAVGGFFSLLLALLKLVIIVHRTMKHEGNLQKNIYEFVFFVFTIVFFTNSTTQHNRSFITY